MGTSCLNNEEQGPLIFQLFRARVMSDLMSIPEVHIASSENLLQSAFLLIDLAPAVHTAKNISHGIPMAAQALI